MKTNMLPDVKDNNPPAHQEPGKSVHGDPSCQEDESEAFWENGIVSASDSWNGISSSADLTVEFIEQLSPAQRKYYRRASIEEKELAEVVHKVHLLCLLGRGILVDGACNDPLIQASLLSLLPPELLKITEVPKLTINTLFPLVKWFHHSFHAQNSSIKEGSLKSNLETALGSRGGSFEEVVALSVALLRALNLQVRFVSVLNAASLKPDFDVSKISSRSETNLDMKALPSMKTVTSPYAVSTTQTSHSLPVNSSMLESNSSQGKKLTPKKLSVDCSAECSTEKNWSPSTSKIYVDKKENDNSTSCSARPKRKGDLEFEMQLEMALSATAAAYEDNPHADPEGLNVTVDQVSPLKRMKSKNKEVTSSTPEKVDAVWSRKMGPPLYWSEVYCSGENLSGRWVHVDPINAIIDGELKIEPAAAVCRRPLRYVVAFSGNGAKDVTRRYCTQWYKIAPYRIQTGWWDAVLAPLKIKVDMESSLPDHATNSGVLEDMELETRALTEPLPTNQQAYRNHHLYVIERWLTKYQILHPKGPVLGYCSGHPVYPRACVKTLQTRNKWLREGLQVKANETPAKIIPRSLKSSEVQLKETNESSISVEDGSSNIELFGMWQTEPLCLPQAVNGIVPKNERGQVDAWSDKCLPLGTVHVRLPRLIPVAKRLGIDYAPAMVGFEFRNGRSLPVFDGIVVCSEFRNAILEAYFEEEARREAEEKKHKEGQALRRWYQLISSMITRQKLSNSYEARPSAPDKNKLSSAATLTDTTNDKGSMGGGMLPALSLQDNSVPSSSLVTSNLHGNHEHIFPLEQQTFDEETSVRTKRCPCGFSIQVEEL